MFGHDGSVAPLKAYLKVLPSDSYLLVDDAHAAGMLGRTGRGTPELEGVSRRRIVQTITLSKAFGTYGGAILGSRKVCADIIARSRIFTGNTPLPLPLAAAALKSIQIMTADKTMRTRLEQNIAHVKSSLRAARIPVPENPSPIIPILPPNKKASAKLKRRLLAARIYPPFIQYPGGPKDGYFRFAISSEHTRKQLDAVIGALVG
jgi:7-keto-8-aminopelargonate synthetase-like enzyme